MTTLIDNIIERLNLTVIELFQQTKKESRDDALEEAAKLAEKEEQLTEGLLKEEMPLHHRTELNSVIVAVGYLAEAIRHLKSSEVTE